MLLMALAAYSGEWIGLVLWNVLAVAVAVAVVVVVAVAVAVAVDVDVSIAVAIPPKEVLL
jgi:hypothetical protein